VNYYFISREEFEKRIAADEMLEYTEYCGNYYGTPKKEALEVLESGKNLILEIEVEGAMNVKRVCPDAVLIMLLPPSFAVQEHRLRSRGTETEEKILARLNRTREEVVMLPRYDYIVYNEDGCDKLAAAENETHDSTDIRLFGGFGEIAAQCHRTVLLDEFERFDLGCTARLVASVPEDTIRSIKLAAIRYGTAHAVHNGRRQIEAFGIPQKRTAGLDIAHQINQRQSASNLNTASIFDYPVFIRIGGRYRDLHARGIYERCARIDPVRMGYPLYVVRVRHGKRTVCKPHYVFLVQEGTCRTSVGGITGDRP
jgi:guanylate kinase